MPTLVNSWVDSIAGFTITLVSGLPTGRNFGFINGVQCLGNDQLSGVGGPLNLQQVYLAFFPNIGGPNTNFVVTMSQGAVVNFALQDQLPVNGFYELEKLTTLNGGSYKFTVRGPTILEVNLLTGVVTLYDWSTGTILATKQMGQSVNTISRITLGDNAGTANTGFIMCRMLGYSQQQDSPSRIQTLEYLVGTPVVFPYQPILNK